MWLLVVSFSIYTHLRRYLYPQYIRTLLRRVVDGAVGTLMDVTTYTCGWTPCDEEDDCGW